jgi:hypothetical protein
MKKLTIVGRGTVGCIAAAHFLRYTNWEIDWIYDPNVQPASVGEGTNLALPQSLSSTVDFDLRDMMQIQAIPKLGIRKRGWGNGTDFFHTFNGTQAGIHFNAVYFQDYFFKKLSENRRVRCIEAAVPLDGGDELDSDYVMMCTGTPKDFSNYNLVDSIPVNAALVLHCPWDNPTFFYSLTFAKKHGWVFGIPIQNRCSIGYVHNSDFSNPEELEDDLQDILIQFNLVPKNKNFLKFNNYYKKDNFNSKVVYNGNASFFLEPLEATSTGTAVYVNKCAYDVWLGNNSAENANNNYHSAMENINCMISLHYYSGSIYKSNFWERALTLGEQRIRREFELKTPFAKFIKKSLLIKSITEFDHNEIGTWPSRSYLQNINGMGQKQKLLDLIEETNC